MMCDIEMKLLYDEGVCFSHNELDGFEIQYGLSYNLHTKAFGDAQYVGEEVSDDTDEAMFDEYEKFLSSFTPTSKTKVIEHDVDSTSSID